MKSVVVVVIIIIKNVTCIVYGFHTNNAASAA